METYDDEFASHRQLAIIEKFEGFINYTYPIAINIRRSHRVIRDRLIWAMFEQVNLFQQAGKSTQVTRKLFQDLSPHGAVTRSGRIHSTYSTD